jgi:hypothetical protein
MQFYDTLAPFDLVARHGYYQVGTSLFQNKSIALQHASRERLPIQWHFNEDAYANMDWRQRLSMPLEQIYRLRAQQLRDRYRYLILCWSGGADSTTILHTFLDNHIPLDEVVILWPLTRSKGRYSPNLDISSTNMMSEWDFSIKPQIDQLRLNHPNLRITIGDMLAENRMIEDRDDTIRITEKHNYTTIQRCRILDDIIKSRMDQHHDLAAIMGVGPLDCVITDRYLSVWFRDDIANTLSASDLTAEGWLRNIEYFYWTPDMPEIVREQAHHMADHLEAYPLDRHYISHMKLDKMGNFVTTHNPPGEIERRFKKRVLYSTWDHNRFQVVKSKDTHFHHDNMIWFHKDAHSRELTDPWESCIRSHTALIDDKFCVKVDGRVVNYHPIITRPYVVRKLSATPTDAFARTVGRDPSCPPAWL